MAKKIPLSNTRRDVIREYGVQHIQSTIDRSKEQKQLAILLREANSAIREKYPEAEMAVLRKYELARVDRCIKVQMPSGRVDGFSFKADCEVADIPYNRHCNWTNNVVYPVSEAFEKAFDAHAKHKADADKLERENRPVQELPERLQNCYRGRAGSRFFWKTSESGW
ncbi:MAG: hypothetical protein U0800_12540 [Isosphaeraceae bacterium]